MVNKDKNNNHSSNSLVLGLWPMAADKITTRNWRGIKEKQILCSWNKLYSDGRLIILNLSAKEIVAFQLVISADSQKLN